MLIGSATLAAHGAVRARPEGVQIPERRAVPRQLVYYEIGDRVHPGDLLFRGEQPFLVVSWRTIRTERHPYIFFALDPGQLKPLHGRHGLYRYSGSLFEHGKR